MTSVRPVQVGAAPDLKSPLRRDLKPNTEHIEHIEVEHAEHTGHSALSCENSDAATLQSLKNIETEAYVAKDVGADFSLVRVILDEVRPDEVLVEMKFCGICHTDIVVQRGLLPLVEFPAILGHEGAGIVRAIGEGVSIRDLAIGDAVLLSFNSCGSCTTCKSGHPAQCSASSLININSVRTSDRSTPARLASDGRPVRSQFFGQSAFGRMSVVNGKSVVRCPPEAVDNLGVYAPLGCGLQTGAGTVLNVIKPGKGDSIVIFGLGSVGLAALMAARYLETSQIIAVDIVPERLAMAKDLGASHIINSRISHDVVQEIKDATGGGPNFAVDCTGVLKVIEDMIACVRPTGTAVQVGVPPAGGEIKINPQMFLLENKRYIGILEGDSYPPDFIPTLIAMHQEGKFPIEKLCRFYAASQLKQAMEDMASGQVLIMLPKVIKPVIRWD
ncbi:Aryl-alcohol dehydrogenase 2 [Colletotrichum chlorophyti]|uniref:Aryl-alcohol dehydrogenase 2 n=1 Tax=Colletotrichum chlorophyti TaxID=708187 RepID=A0A1Q8RQ59_9PEZI|nr:Aryl-alcohol dehydrogenase 2 [Colletotrichum chlorophyti]